MRAILLITLISFSLSIQLNAQAEASMDSLLQWARDAYPKCDSTNQYTDELITLAKTKGNSLKLYEANTTKFYCALYVGDFRKCYTYLSAAENALLEINDIAETKHLRLELNDYWQQYYDDICNYTLSDKYAQATIDILNKKSLNILSHWEQNQLIFAYQTKSNACTYNEKYAAALKSEQHVLSLREKLGDVLVGNYINLAKTYFEIGDFENAIKYYNIGIPLAENDYFNPATAAAKKSNIGDFLCLSYSNLAAAYIGLNKLKKGFNAYKRAHQFQSNESYYKIRLLLNEGEAYVKIGNHDKAAKLFEEAYTLTKAIGLKLASETPTYTTIGDFYANQNNPSKALEYYQSGIINLVADFNDTSIDKNPELENISSKNLLIGCLRRKVAAQYQLANKENTKRLKENAWSTGQLTLDLIEQSMLEVDLLNSDLINIVANNFSLFETMVTIGIDLGYREDVFPIMEQSKSFALLKTLKEADALQELPDSTANKLSLINYEITDLEQQLFTEKSKVVPNDTLIVEIKINLNKKNQERTRFKTELANLQRIEDKVRDFQSVTEVRESLDEEEAVISYIVGEQDSYGVLITKKDYQIKPLDLTPELLEKAAQLKDDISEMRDSLYVTHAHELWQQLIEPFDSLPERLIIMPDGPLYYLPFEALLSEEVPASGKYKWESLPYLLENHAISYSFSSTLLDEIKTRPHDHTPMSKLLGFAPAFKSTNVLVSKIANTRAELSELLYNEGEVKGIGRFMSTDAFVGPDATKEVFLEKAGDYNSIHLATHAKVDDIDPSRSYIAFSNTNESDEKEFKLFANELVNLNLNADLVVLSACETGVGQIFKGEGMISMARGFISAKAKSIVTTLWQIDDQQTKSLMEYFYEKLEAGDHKDVALQLAKKEYLDNCRSSFDAHPFYWAAFVPYCDMTPVRVMRDPSYLSPVQLIFGFFVVVGGWFFWFIFWRRRGKKRALSF